MELVRARYANPSSEERQMKRIVAIALLVLVGACANPMGLDHTTDSGSHTTDSGSHTTDSGSHTTSSGS